MKKGQQPVWEGNVITGAAGQTDRHNQIGMSRVRHFAAPLQLVAVGGLWRFGKHHGTSVTSVRARNARRYCRVDPKSDP
jgi:hypothetical protein